MWNTIVLISHGKGKEAILLTWGSWDLIDLPISKAWLFFKIEV